ncbi:zinc finger-containing ubiquitin peptidase 1-like isoform X1 [Vespa velutina]|uniref:zinc finger-containing ubiquitin peptidase 1-like isoform X1 n=2 Tax=Vespa velutina TaxID=202808 RepID=UPI001FB385B1|nr:zinc finger-containing ubiquitin peptidase 1-like isoform X1 [Vespa velutina]XP_047354398.1 zinc finger-containing ubiquitin peptidase 1-like isoform X1 [Vespa velutina]XP_047354399.1 zinc finger-containing ubiquitin peptidase 1-like isoform X1 [Vespa velutina]XP_047354400.1 zinc finger-containing ubiquitin peptidase 1-like isoform X1 [Vespa velutina]XP_047354401.1 zinc finger-containing ubiquitin peptidase 1-like isoform X1 [Vespa velutina]XP_047354402.1 zinc finger-containing ubiquitin pe
MATNKPPEMNYTCEICGLEGLNDEEMRSHMVLYHLQGAANCPFCDLDEISPAEMLVHVNSAHLDYLTPSTPENDMLAFIDDDSTMEDHRHDECRGPSPSMSLRPPYLQNGWTASHSSRMQQQQLQQQQNSKTRKLDAPAASPNVNNNNNNNDNSNANSVLEGSAGHGSPLRSGLNLQLRSHASPKLAVQECPMCPYSSDSPLRLEEHINRQHFDLTSPSFPPSSPPTKDGVFNCPLCVTSFPNSSDLELHVNIEHKDILSPANGTALQSDLATIGSDTPPCPVCLSTSFKNNDDLTLHIEEHFNKKNTPSPITPDLSTDRMLAKDMERREKEVRKLREQREFEMLRAQYGMDNQGNFREQSVTNMQRAVLAGEMTVADFYERQTGLTVAESSGIDDSSSCTRGLVPKIRAVSQTCSNVVNTWMCSTVDHYASTYGDKGWGCGYRNMQMLISSLLQHTGYNELVYKAWSSGLDSGSTTDNPLRSSMPSISRLQKMIEWAWAQGFDIQGAEQLGGKLMNTRKWIGATEVVTLLSSLKIKCQLVDFHRPTSVDGGHPEMFNWVLQYFQRCDDFKPPLYLQHQGHSRTIMGVERLRDGSITMLVLDPSHSPSQMAQFNSTSSAPGAMRLVRKSTAAMKAKQYQVVAVTGIMDTEEQYQQSKVLRSMRVPQDR